MQDWALKDWLEAATYVIAIVGAIAYSYIYLSSAREEAIVSATEVLQQAWTNEGDISSSETHFITFDLANSDGDLIGSLQTSQYPRTLDVYAEVGWFSTRVYVSELSGRSVLPVAEVKIKISGNKNRLSWNVTEGNQIKVLPQETTLWPSPVGVSR